MLEKQHFRAILLKLQDRLTDDDRKRLHFFFGNDVPRRIRDDPSLGGTLNLMESLFDQDKVNQQDFTFLIEAFDVIHCTDAAKLLRKHMAELQKNDGDARVQSLNSILSVVPDSPHKNNEDGHDKFNVAHHFHHHSASDMNSPTKNNDQIKTMTPPKPQLDEEEARSTITILRRSFDHKSLPTLVKCLPLFILVLIVALFVLIGFFIEQNIRLKQVTKNLTMRNDLISELRQNETEALETIAKLKGQMLEMEKDSNNLLVRTGIRFGGNGGGTFDDSIMKNFSCSFYISGIVTPLNSINMNWFQFLYSSADYPNAIFKGDMLGERGKDELTEQYLLHTDERVSRIQVKLHNETLLIDGKEKLVLTIKGIRLFTDKGRASRPINPDDGTIVTENFDGYTLGYARGRKGLRVDQIQFLWYRVISD